MTRLLPYALYLGLVSILGHLAFITLGGLGHESLFIDWIKLLVVFAAAWWLLADCDLARRYRGPDWLWMAFGGIGALGTLLLLTQLGTWAVAVIYFLLLPIAWTGILHLLPLMQYAML